MRARLIPILILLPAVLISTACGGDDPDFLAPGAGDFVQLVQPGDGDTITSDEFARRSVSIVLNFTIAEGFTFATLQSFRYDGDDVRDRLDRVNEGDPLQRVSFSFQPDEAEEGSHEVQVVYADTRGTIHRIRWDFEVEG